MTNAVSPSLSKYSNAPRQRGAAAVLAMMFLVIFSSLTAAMAIVSQGNLRTADSHLKINRSLAAAETGMQFATFRLEQIVSNIRIREGVIDDTLAENLWLLIRDDLITSFSGEFHNIQEPYVDNGVLYAGPIAIGPGAPQFTVSFQPHPIPGEDYDSEYYQREPYTAMTPAISAANPLGPQFVRVRVVAQDGPVNGRIFRSIEMDFEMGKRIRFALLSNSRIMIGRNVMIEGPVGSRFNEVDLNNGHPVVVESDFRGINAALDTALDTLVGTLITNDLNGDNRLSVNNSAEVDGIVDPAALDLNDDGYIDDYDFFLDVFDANTDGSVTATELDANSSNITNSTQLLTLIDTFGNPLRAGYNDGQINELDRYAKIRGEIHISASVADWEAGAADGTYQDFLQGPIHNNFGTNALTFNATENQAYEFTHEDFDVASFEAMATGDLLAQASSQISGTGPDAPAYDPTGVTEAVPFESPYPYDYYERPVFRNMVFTNIYIPKGTNALFENCTFRGVTYIETETDNDDPNFNYAGMQESDGEAKHPDRFVTLDADPSTEVYDTKAISNNIRFHNCTFEGSVVTGAAEEFTHTRNKLTFTGQTDFQIDESTYLSDSEKQLFKRSAILAPHYSVEMGTFIAPFDASETVELSGTIVAGVLDMRGQVEVNGSIITTFLPQSDTGPVIGQTSPQFNTTLGYFGSAAGDLEAELPTNGIGIIKVRYDPTLPLPDGILAPIELRPLAATYSEGGQ